MKLLVLAVATTLLGLTAAEASGSLYGPIHIERQRGSTLTIEHTPVARRVVRRTRTVVRHKVRRAKVVAVRKARRRALVRVVRSEFVRNPAIAGDCREGGFVRRRIGAATVRLQREVCENIAPNPDRQWALQTYVPPARPW